MYQDLERKGINITEDIRFGEAFFFFFNWNMQVYRTELEGQTRGHRRLKAKEGCFVVPPSGQSLKDVKRRVTR